MFFCGGAAVQYQIDQRHFHLARVDALEDAATWLDAEQMLHPPPYGLASEAIRYNTLEDEKTHIREMENE